MTIEELNKSDADVLKSELQKCCGSSQWVDRMLELRPYQDGLDLLFKADQAWNLTREEDWLEAFSHHPKIGDLKSLEKKFASTKALAGSEQASVHTASTKVLEELAAGNQAYENKFGFIFIVCASGKSAEEMLALLKSRLGNSRNTELKIAASEQLKITILRIKKILT